MWLGQHAYKRFPLAVAQLCICSYQRWYTKFAAQVKERFKTKYSDVTKVIKYSRRILIKMFVLQILQIFLNTTQ